MVELSACLGLLDHLVHLLDVFAVFIYLGQVYLPGIHIAEPAEPVKLPDLSDSACSSSSATRRDACIDPLTTAPEHTQLDEAA